MGGPGVPARARISGWSAIAGCPADTGSRCGGACCQPQHLSYTPPRLRENGQCSRKSTTSTVPPACPARAGTLPWHLDRSLRRLVRAVRSRLHGYYSWVGIRDATASGWFSMQTRQLCPDFASMLMTSYSTWAAAGAGTTTFARTSAITLSSPILIRPRSRRWKSLPSQRRSAQIATAIVTDANPLPLADETATKVISTEVIEHVDDVQRFLREFAR